MTDQRTQPHAGGTSAGPLHPDPGIVAIAGDWHGNTRWALGQIRNAHEHGATTIVHVGDFGFWTDCDQTTAYLGELDELLTDYGMWLLWVDGNHEDHARLATLPVDPATGLRPITARIHHLPRGFRWTWHGRDWMALGGAHSVDRAQRCEGVSWWPGEFLTPAEVEYACRDGNVDVMLCHDSPTRADVPVLRGPSSWPQYDLAASAQHRALIQHVVDTVRPAVLWHGHYHCRYDDVITRPDGGTTVIRGLAEDGTWPQGNMILLDLTAGAVGTSAQ